MLWEFPTAHDLALGRRLRFNDDAFVASGGRAIVANEEEAHTIVSVNVRTHARVHLFGTPGVKGAGARLLNTPDDAYPLPDGSILVADAYNCRVLRIRDHRIERQFGSGTCRHDPPRSFGALNGDTPLQDGGMLLSEIPGHWVDDIGPNGELRAAIRAPLRYPSDPQPLTGGRILVADYANPGAVIVIDHTGRLLWRYGPATGPGRLDHPSLAAALPNGDIAVNDDYRHRIVIIDPSTGRIVWQYGHTDRAGTGPGFLNTPDGMDFVPLSGGRLDWAAVHHPAAPGVLRGDRGTGAPAAPPPSGALSARGPSAAGSGAAAISDLPPLAAPTQDAAAAALPGGGALVAGGLGPTGSSRADVAGVRAAVGAGRLPAAAHDAAAVALGRSVYLFGGGQAASFDRIVAIDPASGATRPAGRLPQPRSDLAAAVVGHTVYLVGGYTGSSALDTILAWRPGGRAKVVARLPQPLRYAAVAAAGSRVIIVGGSGPAAASRAVLSFDPARRTVRAIGTLPAPLTHAGAATVGSTVYVVGGRGSAPDTPTDRVLAIDPATGRVTAAGTLPRPLSDAAVVSGGGDLLVIGGRSGGRPQASVLRLRPGR